ncbi:MAG: transcription elongation factor GreA [Magnetococcus sp. DMHC-6]
MTTRVPMTLAGAEKLRELLKRLKTVERPKIIEAISVARDHGDLSENAEYHAAKEQHSFNEGRIKEIESKLAAAEIIDTKQIKSSRVVFGAWVTLLEEENEREVTYQIVGEDEADFETGKISIASPVARALIGKEEGDEIIVRAPGGDRSFEILAIRYK